MKCEICGTPLKESWKTKCYNCYKKTEFKGKKDINELIKKYNNCEVSEKVETDYKMGTNRRKKWGLK